MGGESDMASLMSWLNDQGTDGKGLLPFRICMCLCVCCVLCAVYLRTAVRFNCRYLHVWCYMFFLFVPWGKKKHKAKQLKKQDQIGHAPKISKSGHSLRHSLTSYHLPILPILEAWKCQRERCWSTMIWSFHHGMTERCRGHFCHLCERKHHYGLVDARC